MCDLAWVCVWWCGLVVDVVVLLWLFGWLVVLFCVVFDLIVCGFIVCVWL